jgi:hypothetical protein
MHPAMYGERKFDMRVWAMITSIDPLRIVLNRKFMPKISTKHYSTSVLTKDDSCMHFKMPMGTECKKEYLPEPYPIHTAISQFYRNVKFKHPVFDTAEFWNRVVVPQVSCRLVPFGVPSLILTVATFRPCRLSASSRSSVCSRAKSPWPTIDCCWSKVPTSGASCSSRPTSSSTTRAAHSLWR